MPSPSLPTPSTYNLFSCTNATFVLIKFLKIKLFTVYRATYQQMNPYTGLGANARRELVRAERNAEPRDDKNHGLSRVIIYLFNIF